jgi:predicted lipoprotein with Yx(FWY)xxD motif
MNRTLLALLVGLALALTACGGSGQADGSYGVDPAPASAPAQPQAAVSLGDSSLGQILVDADGRTLYGFTKDKNGASSCSGDCAVTWPALTVEGGPIAGDGVQASLLASTERSDGSSQATYNGMPLYYFSGDQQPGDTNGQGIGGSWFMVAADGVLIRGGEDGKGRDEPSGGSYTYP